MNNEKAKNAKQDTRFEMWRIQKPQFVKRFMNLVSKIHEVARGKGPLS
jgi:hypothetical protein